MLATSRTEATTALCVLLAGTASVGIPTYLGARRNRSHRPIVQSLVWVASFAVAAVMLSEHYLERTALAQPGELNINTFETMRERQASFDRWGVAPEVVSSFMLTLTVVVASSFCGGLLSALVGSGWGRTRLMRGMLFGLATAVATTAGLALIPVGTYVLAIAMVFAGRPPVLLFLAPLPGGFVIAALLAGCLAGSIIEYARAALLPHPAPGARLRA